MAPKTMTPTSAPNAQSLLDTPTGGVVVLIGLVVAAAVIAAVTFGSPFVGGVVAAVLGAIVCTAFVVMPRSLLRPAVEPVRGR